MWEWGLIFTTATKNTPSWLFFMVILRKGWLQGEGNTLPYNIVKIYINRCRQIFVLGSFSL